MIINGREALARIYESKFAEDIDANLAARAEEYFQERVIDRAAKETVAVVYDAANKGTDATLLVRNALAKATELAAIDTAEAIRNGTL